MTILRLAWRNLWRNKRRTAVTMAAVSLNVAILIASTGLMEGMMENFLSNATNLIVGEAQIHVPKFLVDRSMYKSLKNPEDIIDRLKREGVPASARSYGFGLVAHETKSAGALFWGIDPKVEGEVFDLVKNIHRGEFLSSRAEGVIVLGKKLARSLGVSVGDEIVVVVQAADGSLGNELYTVGGILKSAGDSIDRDTAILHRTDFEALFVSGGRIHEIALNSRGAIPIETLGEIASRAAPEAEAKTWRQLMPSLSDMVNLFDVSMWFFWAIFFLAAAMGVMNTMLMATFERIREFGVLKALGTSPWRIMGDVAGEAFVLAVVSSVIGIVMGVPVALYLQEVGLDMSVFASGDVTIAGVAFDPVWRAAISAQSIYMPVVVMWVVCLLASLYPAAIAARLDPVKAMVHV